MQEPERERERDLTWVVLLKTIGEGFPYVIKPNTFRSVVGPPWKHGRRLRVLGFRWPIGPTGLSCVLAKCDTSCVRKVRLRDRFQIHISIYVYIYTYVCVCVRISIYIYTVRVCVCVQHTVYYLSTCHIIPTLLSYQRVGLVAQGAGRDNIPIFPRSEIMICMSA